ncbi:hypothetical protein K1X76_01325 [bacterium]|nr:hypothetical protein [bacterium]
MKKIIVLLVFILLASLRAQAGILEAGSKVFLAPMANGMDKFVAAEILKQKLPITITTDENQAQYVLTGSTVDKGSNHKWYDVMFGSAGMRDSVQASFMLVRKADKSIVWAGNAGDRSFWFGALKRGGERKAAIRLVRNMKSQLFKKG